MKYLVLFLISFYKIVVSPLLKLILGTQSMCRFSPSCSEYAENVIKQYGVFVGSMMFLRRFLKCQPFYKGSIKDMGLSTLILDKPSGRAIRPRPE